MDFSKKEMQRRFAGLDAIMHKHDLNGVIIMGDTVVNAPFINFSQRYFTQNNLIESFQILFCIKDSEPILICAGPLQYEANKERSQIQNCTMSANQIAKVVEIMRDNNLCAGRIGCTLDMIPASWYIELQEELPELQLVEINKDITALHYLRSNEEIEKAKTSASIADKAYTHVLPAIKVGMSEYEVAAEIDYVTNRLGASKNFTLIVSGAENEILSNGILKIYPASKRLLKDNDTVIFEISPQFDGYWTQLLRTVCIAEKPSPVTEALHRVCVDAINGSLSRITPGAAVSDIWGNMNEYVASHGFSLIGPIGHVASVDLVDDRLAATNTRALNWGETLIIHPCVGTKDNNHCFLWGQTYLVTENGAISLNNSSDDFICVSGNQQRGNG